MDEADRMYLLRDNWTKFTKNVGPIGWLDSQVELFGHGIFAGETTDLLGEITSTSWFTS
jgi:hypothetical protein